MFRLRIIFIFLIASALVDFSYAITIPSAEVEKGKVIIVGRNAQIDAPISWNGKPITRADGFGRFEIQLDFLPDDCAGVISDGVSQEKVVIRFCGHKGDEGEKGAAGEKGPKGDKGDPGVSVSGYERVTNSCPGISCSVACPRNKKVIGGGCGIDPALGSRLINSHPLDDFSWRCEYSVDETTQTQRTHSMAICAAIVE